MTYIARNPNWPSAVSYITGKCEMRGCGLHILALDEAEEVLAEIVVPPDQLESLIARCQEVLAKERGGGLQ